MQQIQCETLIIGASAAGLACAACLTNEGLPFIILDQQDKIGQSWSNHYDRLHLHTHRNASHLPYMPFPKSYPKYPSKDHMVAYLDSYAQKFNINPVFNRVVKKLSKTNHLWLAETNEESYMCQQVIVATGNARKPNFISKPGLENFSGKVLHSSQYKNGEPFRNQKVLVVGFGNSACEICNCLHEHGAFPALSVRSAVNVIPREILGIPVLSLGLLTKILSPGMADKLNKPVIDLIIGDITKYGLKKLPYGPKVQIIQDRRIPLLDNGTIELIKKGKIRVFDDIRRIEGNTIYFFNQMEEHFDAIILGTGYKHGLEDFITLEIQRLTDLEESLYQRTSFGKNNLYFCGFHVSDIGMLREISSEAKQIASMINLVDNDLNPQEI